MQDIQLAVDMPKSSDATARVLMVDDQAIVVEAVRRMLHTEKDIIFHFCSDGEQAVAQAALIRPTVILQDLVMPNTDGLSLVRDYRTTPATSDTPVIVLSTKEDSKVKSAAFAAGANDYLVKLPDPLELIARIRYHSRSHTARLERDAAWQALRQSQKQLMKTHLELQILLDTVPTGILKLDAGGHIVQCNQAAQALLKIQVDELHGSAFIDMLAAEARAQFMQRLEAAAIGNADSHYTEAEIWQRSGHAVPVEYLLTPLPSAQGIELTLVMRDITERKAADRAKSEFIATVSHELRTPLTSIRGALGLALSGKLGELPERARHLLDIASRNSDQLAQLVNDLLDLEKITQGGMRFAVTPLAVDAVLESALAANDGYALRHNVQLHVGRCTSDEHVRADEFRLQQVFANLISNAIKYSPLGGIVELSARQSGDTIRFGVRDYGSGIPEAFRDRIFQRFSQADSSDARAQGGTGLGLNIARSIVEQMGGSIGFDTSEAGTEFFFRLPRADAASLPESMSTAD